jgi:hypothetical protein
LKERAAKLADRTPMTLIDLRERDVGNWMLRLVERCPAGV